MTDHDISTNSRTLEVRISIIDPRKVETAPPIASMPWLMIFISKEKRE